MEQKREKTTYRIYLEGKKITDIDSFYKQINKQLMLEEDWEIAASLDAFDDLLYGGFSKWKDYDQLEIVWEDIEISRQHLDFDTTIKYYQSKIYPGSPYNQSLFRQKINDLENCNGQTYFDLLMEIINNHKDRIKLIKS